MLTLKQLGWNLRFAQAFQKFESQGFTAGRVSVENRDNYRVLTEVGEFPAQIAGRLLYTSDSKAELPKVGDWVVVTVFPEEEKALIHEILPRQTTFSRKAASKRTEAQVMATNLDHVYVVQSLDENYNLNRLERYLVMIRESGAKPGIILNKADLVEDSESFLQEVEKAVVDVPVFLISAKTGDGFNKLREHLHSRETIALVGSSGVGKSTIINQLAGSEIQKTQEVRLGDSKGRHTTTRRELILLPDGGMLIDTPGMREFQLWSADEGLEDTFDDILKIAQDCRFNDCTHTHEVGCAVKKAVEENEISEQYLENYLKLQKELEYLESKQDEAVYRNRQERWKQIHKDWKQLKKEQRKYR